MIRGWENELASIPLDGASLADVDDAKLLRAQLVGYERQYLVYKTYEKDPSAPSLAIMNAIYTQFLHLPIAGTAGATKADVAAAWQKIIRPARRRTRVHRGGQRAGHPPGPPLRRHGAEQLAGAPSFLGGPLTDAAKEQLPADRFAEFVKARDATLAAIEQTKKYIDAHAASWPENYAMGAPLTTRCSATRSCCRSTPTTLSAWRATSSRTDGPYRSGWKNSPPSVARRSGRRAAAASLPGVPRSSITIARVLRNCGSSSRSITSSMCRRGSVRWSSSRRRSFCSRCRRALR
jgi:hypothetical protein